VKRLIASDEQGGGLLRIERRPQPRERLLGPVLRRALGRDPKVHALGSNEHPIGVLEAPRFDAVDPDREGVAESGARLFGRTDEIRDHGAAGLHHAVAHPSHAARVLDPVRMAEAEIAREIRAHRIGIEHHGIEQRRERIRQRGLARSRETHDQNLAHRRSSSAAWI
jgi:hypothetical protein